MQTKGEAACEPAPSLPATLAGSAGGGGQAAEGRCWQEAPELEKVLSMGQWQEMEHSLGLSS